MCVMPSVLLSLLFAVAGTVAAVAVGFVFAVAIVVGAFARCC